MGEVQVVRVSDSDPQLLAEARRLLVDYEAWLGDAVCAEALASEIADLPGPYGPPTGALLLACDDRACLGVVGVRRHGDGVAEIKRLWVAPDSRGRGVGGMLAEVALEACCELGYREVVVTTLADRMAGALSMYRALGFRETEPFEDFSRVTPGLEVTYLRRALGAVEQDRA